MSHVQHELHDEFPEYKEKIHALKTGDRHFARLFDEYHVVNREFTAMRSTASTLPTTLWKR